MSEPLFKELADEQDRLRARAGHQMRVMPRLLAASERSSGGRRRGWYLALAPVTLVVSFLVWRHAATLHTVDARVSGTGLAAPKGVWLGSDQPEGFGLEFSEGTKVDLASGALARVIRLTPTGGRLELKHGRASLQVAPLPGADWSLQAGPFTIVVTGTKFDVSWLPEADSFKVVMHEGQVSLVGCGFGEGRALTAGQTARARCKDGKIAVGYGQEVMLEPSAETGSPPNSPSDAPSALASGEAASVAGGGRTERAVRHDTPVRDNKPDGSRALGSELSASAQAIADWKGPAQAGDYEKALETVEEAGFESTLARLGASELMLLGETARHAGALERASQAFLALRQRFAGTNEASMAAFALGRLSFDARRAYPVAARWFNAYLKEQPEGAFAREALGRLMEAHFYGSNAGLSKRLAQRYLKLYPAGPHAELATRIVRGD